MGPGIRAQAPPRVRTRLKRGKNRARPSPGLSRRPNHGAWHGAWLPADVVLSYERFRTVSASALPHSATSIASPSELWYNRANYTARTRLAAPIAGRAGPLLSGWLARGMNSPIL